MKTNEIDRELNPIFDTYALPTLKGGRSIPHPQISFCRAVSLRLGTAKDIVPKAWAKWATQDILINGIPDP
ncbi:MAG: hypothetical protein AAFP20_19240 [Cyanobacteria bacterium J06614_10]